VGGDLSDSWRKEATDRLLAVGPGVIGVGTVRNMDVPVVVEIADAEPAHDRKAWNQVNECSVEAVRSDRRGWLHGLFPRCRSD